MSLYVLYHQKYKSDFVGGLGATIKQFEGLYEKYKIDIIGHWSVEGNESEMYLLYKYDSDEDYKTKAGLLQEDSDYQVLSAGIKESRLSMEETRLVPVWVPE